MAFVCSSELLIGELGGSRGGEVSSNAGGPALVSNLTTASPPTHKDRLDAECPAGLDAGGSKAVIVVVVSVISCRVIVDSISPTDELGLNVPSSSEPSIG